MTDATARTRRLDPAPLVALGLFALARLAGVSAITVPLGMLIAGLVPGLAFLRLLGLASPDRASRWALAAALGVPLSAALTCLGALGGLSPPLGLAAVAVASALVCALSGRPGRGDDRGIAIAAIAIASAALVLVPEFSPFVRNWSDAWFHGAVYSNVVERGVPPDFPHFAGQPLPYPWLFHVWLAGLGGWLDRDPFVLMAALNVFTALMLPATVWALARSMGVSAGAASGAAVAFMIGINPMGAVILLGRAFTGETRGLQALMPALHDSNTIIWSLAHNFSGFDGSLWARLWTPTAFNFALVITGGVACLAIELWRSGERRHAVGLALAAAGLFLWHTLTAYAMGIGIVGATACALLAPSREVPFRARVIRAVAMGAALVAGYAVALPYLRLVTQGMGGGQLLRFHLSQLNLHALVLASGPLTLCAAWSIARRAIDARVMAWCVGLVLTMLAAFLIFDLPGIAEEKLFYPPVLVLAALAGPAIAQAWSRGGLPRVALSLLAACGVVTTALAYYAFANDPRPVRELFTSDRTPGASVMTVDEVAAFQWMREGSPRDAVFLQWPRPYTNEPLLVHGGRRLYLGPAELFYRAIFFPSAGRAPASPAIWAELERRQRTQNAVFSDAPLPGDVLAELAQGPGPLYIWHDAQLGGGVLSPTVTRDSSRFTPAFVSPQVTIYRIGTPP